MVAESINCSVNPWEGAGLRGKIDAVIKLDTEKAEKTVIFENVPVKNTKLVLIFRGSHQLKCCSETFRVESQKRIPPIIMAAEYKLACFKKLGIFHEICGKLEPKNNKKDANSRAFGLFEIVKIATRATETIQSYPEKANFQLFVFLFCSKT